MRRKMHARFLQQLSAEFFSTALLLAIGTGSSVVYRLTAEANGPSPMISIFGWATAVVFGVATSLGISGAHLNPTVSFAFALSGSLPWYKFPGYCLAQILGAFCGSAVTFMIYSDSLNSIDGGVRSVAGVNGTAGLFATYASPAIPISSSLLNEVFATAVLLFCIMALIDKKNLNLPLYLLPVMVGLLILCINCSFCYKSGCAMNPARDLGPRLFTLVAGWGVEVFSYRDWNWFWVPIVGPMIGGSMGLYVYKFVMEFSCCNLHDLEDVSKSSSPVIVMKSTENPKNVSKNIGMRLCRRAPRKCIAVSFRNNHNYTDKN